MTFDRLIYIDRLKEAGVAELVARAHAEALSEALFETVAKKADLDHLGAALRGEMKDIRTELKQDIARVETTLDTKIELTARNLTIRGAGGLIVIATLLIGLKIFG